MGNPNTHSPGQKPIPQSLFFSILYDVMLSRKTHMIIRFDIHKKKCEDLSIYEGMKKQNIELNTSISLCVMV